MTSRVAFIASGRLHVRSLEGRVDEVPSEFVAQVRERALSIHRRKSWQGGGLVAQVTGRPDAGEPDVPVVRATGLARGPSSGSLCYALDTGAVSGVFLHDGARSERRLFHSDRLRVRDVVVKPDGVLLACAVASPQGAHLAVMPVDGTDLQEVTEGESIDLAPAWAPTGRRLAYQSAGLAQDLRRAQGHGPFEILEIDLDAGDVRTLASDPERDLLGPQWASDGALWYVRCPHRPAGPTAARRVLHALGAPLRMMAGLYHFLDFWTRANTGRPTTAGGPKRQLSDTSMKQLLVQGAIDQAALDAPEQESDARHSEVSSSWELVRQSPDGSVRVVHAGVAAFDLASDGTVVATNGRDVMALGADGARVDLARSRYVQRVVAL